MNLEALITFPGDIDLIAADAEPAKGKLVLQGDSLTGAIVYADGHRIGTALAVERQEYDAVYSDQPAPDSALIYRTMIAMRLEVPLP